MTVRRTVPFKFWPPPWWMTWPPNPWGKLSRGRKWPSCHEFVHCFTTKGIDVKLVSKRYIVVFVFVPTPTSTVTVPIHPDIYCFSFAGNVFFFWEKIFALTFFLRFSLYQRLQGGTTPWSRDFFEGIPLEAILCLWLMIGCQMRQGQKTCFLLL